MSEAPGRIYLQDAGDYEGAAKLEVTWCVEPQDDDDTAYIRADLVEDAVKRAIEECAEACDDNHRGGLPKHIQSADGVLLRKWLSDPEAIAKIIQGDA